MGRPTDYWMAGLCDETNLGEEAGNVVVIVGSLRALDAHLCANSFRWNVMTTRSQAHIT